MVIYYSGTGNSRFCAAFIAEQLEDAYMNAGDYIKNQTAANVDSQKPLVFVAPTYAWRLPRIFEDFIRKSSFSGVKDAYFIMTCGGDIGNAGAEIAKLCRQAGLTYQGVLEMIMPENYIALFNVPDEKEIAEIVAAAHPALEAAAGRIKQGKPFPEVKASLFDRFKSGPINPIFYQVFVKAKKFYATDDCIGCGACVKRCPLNNIALENGKPRWGGDCTHCMACICGCPKEAIEYGKNSKGKPRYWFGK